MAKINLQLSVNAFNQLLMHSSNTLAPIAVTPVRAFPIAAPDTSIALVDDHGTEHQWIERLTDLPDEAAQLIQRTLASQEITPIILRITQVSRFATPCEWQVDTNHGPTELNLKTEDDIRPLPSGGFLVTDGFGLQFKIPHRSQLDRQSQRFLTRFL